MTRMVDYHKFLVLFLARTQRPLTFDHQTLLTGAGGRYLLAQAYSQTATGNASAAASPFSARSGGGGAASDSPVVDVATGKGLQVDAVRSAGGFAVVITISTHGHGAMSAADATQSGSRPPMMDTSAEFLEFKSSGERGLDLTIHKIKWPTMAAALHKAAGLDAKEAVKNQTSKAGPQGGVNSAAHASSAQVTQPFLVARQRVVRITENWSKLVWFKQGLKGAVGKVSRAFSSSLTRPADLPGAGTFDLLQVCTVYGTE